MGDPCGDMAPAGCSMVAGTAFSKTGGSAGPVGDSATAEGTGSVPVSGGVEPKGSQAVKAAAKDRMPKVVKTLLKKDAGHAFTTAFRK